MAQDIKPAPWQRTIETLDPDVLMSKDEAETVTDDIAGGLRQIEEITSELAMKIADAKDRGAWKVLGYDSWGAYVDEAIGTTRRHADRLAKYGRMVESLLEASGWTLGPIEVHEALPERAFRDTPSEIAAGLPAAVADAVKGKRGKNRTRAAVEVVGSARPDPKPKDTIETAPDQAPPGDESVGAAMTTAQEPPADDPGGAGFSGEPGPAATGADSDGSTVVSPIGEIASETTDPPADVPKDRGPRTMKEWLLQSAVSSVEELQDAGPGSILPNAAQRIAQAAGFILITVAQYEQYQKAMRENAEHKMDAPTEPPPPSIRVRRPQTAARPQPLRREIVEPNFKGSKK